MKTILEIRVKLAEMGSQRVNNVTKQKCNDSDFAVVSSKFTHCIVHKIIQYCSKYLYFVHIIYYIRNDQ